MKLTGITRGKARCGLLLGMLGFLAGCVSLPEQPSPATPHALVVFSATIRLVALDGQALDPRLQLTSLRLSPGRHTLRLRYDATASGGSAAHHGQEAAPLVLEARAGWRYELVAHT